jgi:hypothetical protein
MATFHDLRIRRRELLDDLDELEASVVELTVVLSESVAVDTDELTDHHERLAWLHRQRAGLLVVLSETERALLEFDADGWDE